MSAPSKPPRRLPKPRKPIRRTVRPSRVRKTPSGAARRSADLIWAKAVRESGPCAALQFPVPLGDGWCRHVRCSGQIEAAHGFGRTWPASRTDPANGFPLCHGAHRWFTEHPDAWTEFLKMKLGLEAYEALRLKAQGRTE